MTTLTTQTRNILCDTTTGLVDQGSTNSSGSLVFRASDDSIVANLSLSLPAYSRAVDGTATANPITSDTDAEGGDIAYFTIEDRDNTEIFRGTVTDADGGGDIQVDGGLSIGAGATVACDSLTHTEPA